MVRSSPMKIVTRFVATLATGALLLLPLTITGCSSDPEAKTAKIQAGDMPSGGDWTGVAVNRSSSKGGQEQ